MRSGERRLHSLEKIVAIGALAAVLFVSVGFARAGDGPKLRSSVALVQDAESGETLYEKNSDTILPIASITKLMTAIVILDGGLNLEQRVAVSAEDLRATRSARVRGRLRPGSVLTRDELLLLTLMASENRAAAALARTYPGGTEAFVAAMNAKAQSLGLQKTMFTEPTGLDPANISTAVEMAHLALAAFKYPEIASTSVLNGITMSARQPDQTIRDIPVVNRNYSLLQFNVDGAKTGFLYEAQRSVAVQKGNITAVVLHARSMKERNQLIEKLLISP